MQSGGNCAQVIAGDEAPFHLRPPSPVIVRSCSGFSRSASLGNAGLSRGRRLFARQSARPARLRCNWRTRALGQAPYGRRIACSSVRTRRAAPPAAAARPPGALPVAWRNLPRCPMPPGYSLAADALEIAGAAIRPRISRPAPLPARLVPAGVRPGRAPRARGPAGLAHAHRARQEDRGAEAGQHRRPLRAVRPGPAPGAGGDPAGRGPLAGLGVRGGAPRRGGPGLGRRG